MLHWHRPFKHVADGAQLKQVSSFCLGDRGVTSKVIGRARVVVGLGVVVVVASNVVVVVVVVTSSVSKIAIVGRCLRVVGFWVVS